MEKTTSLRLPFLGSNAKHNVFQYILLKITSRSALIAIPNWVLQRTQLNNNEYFNLHLNHLLPENSYSKINLKGPAESLSTPISDFGDLYRVKFNPPLKLVEGSEFQLTQEKIDIAPKILKDTLLIKSGIAVYLKHAIPFFSRILKTSAKRYESLKELILEDIQKHLNENILKLEELYKESLSNKLTPLNFTLFFDLENFREMVESEIDLALLELAFEDNVNQIRIQVNNYSIKSYHAYLEAIKSLEERLYINYNRIVSLYCSFNKI